MIDNGSRFQRSLLDPADFTLTLELVPSRGGQSRGHSRVLSLAREASADGRLHAVSITENAGGHPALSPEVLGSEINKLGLDVIIHLSCKDKNRNQIESLLFAWDRAGLRDLLVITGDYPQRGYRGHPKPVFDLDSVHALDLISRLNCQQPGRDRRNPAVIKSVDPTSFSKGAAISPFKLKEEELWSQYYKLHRKAAAGADYLITQVGYDARKFHELLQYMELNGLDLPVLGNVFIPTPTIVKMVSAGKIPGVVIQDRVNALMEEEFKEVDKGRKKGLLRAAKLLCVLRGLGYAGAHIGGPAVTFKELDHIFTEAERMADDWPEFLVDFQGWPEDAYIFEADDKGELNSTEVVGRRKGAWSLHYSLARSVHDLAFREEALLYEVAEKICTALNDSRAGDVFGQIEHIAKLILFGCRNCGDCTLAELGFLCPQSGCAKAMLNGPCGGSRDGWCEVYPGRKKCFYVMAYKRLKAVGLEESLKRGFLPPRDWSLNESSSWINFFMRRDHTATGK